MANPGQPLGSPRWSAGLLSMSMLVAATGPRPR